MSTIKSSTEHLTLNADGAGKEIKFQANGVEKASISSAGAFTSTSIDATKLSGALPAIDGSALTNLPVSGLGVGQTWQNVSASRATNTIYTNSTGETIVVMVVVGLNGAVYNLIDGLSFTEYATSGCGASQLIVPAGSTYRIHSSAVAANSWLELR